MISINRHDIFKTILIIWFIGATGYVVFDQWSSYKVRGIQAAYQQGYTDSVTALIDQTQKSGCTPFDVQKGDTKIQLVSGQCLQQASAAAGQVQPQQPAASQIAPKK
jgi:hypothetical protein